MLITVLQYQQIAHLFLEYIIHLDKEFSVYLLKYPFINDTYFGIHVTAFET